MEAIIDDLASGFDEFGVYPKDGVILACAEICQKHNIDTEDFVASWFAYAASNNKVELDDQILIPFSKHLLSSRTKKNDQLPVVNINLNTSQGEKVPVYGRSTIVTIKDDDDDDMDNDRDDVLQVYGGYSSETPKTNKKLKPRLRPSAIELTPKSGFSPAGYSPAVQSESTSYRERTKAGETVMHYKCKDSSYWDEIPKSTNGSKVVSIFPAQATKNVMAKAGFKYIFQNTTDVSTLLNSNIIELADEDEKELNDLRVSSLDDSWYLGRIRAEDGRLSQGSTYLEGDLERSGGHTVSLDLSNAQEYRLFPGQVVMIKGKNELGKCLRVSEIFLPPASPRPTILPGTTSPLNIIIACGPFSPSDSFKCEPLSDLLEVVKRDKPNVCILLGPFVDSAHPLIGELADTFDYTFDTMVDMLKESFGNLGTHLVLVPNYGDAHHHLVYPTPQFSLKYRNKISAVPDPATIEVGGITIGLTSADILMHLGNNEISKSTIADRMGGLSKLILSQRNFYPLYPSDESVPFEVQLWADYCKFTNTPHIMILPSDLRHFIKEVDGVVIVNPQRLTKGKSGGTYVRLQVKLPEQFQANMDSVADYCCGEIVKI